MLPLIKIGPIGVSVYWLMFGIGVGSIVVLMQNRRLRYSLTRGKALLFAILITIFGLSGVKLLAVVENWQEVISKGISAAGQSFFGAVLLLPIGMMLCAKAFRMTKGSALDATAPCIASMIAIMRVGCFFEGCCGGMEAELFGFRFHWPTQAMESIGDFLILSILLQMEERNACAEKRYSVFLVGYGILRFFVEFLRDTEKMLLGLGNGQWFALIAVSIGGAILLRGSEALRVKNG